MGKAALRRCLICRLLFASSGPGERICQPCRKKRKGKNIMPIDIVPVTPQMARHMDYVTVGRRGDLENRDEFQEDFVEKAHKYLDNEEYDFDDSDIYAHLDEEYQAYADDGYYPEMVDDRPSKPAKARFNNTKKAAPKAVSPGRKKAKPSPKPVRREVKLVVRKERYVREIAWM